MNEWIELEARCLQDAQNRTLQRLDERGNLHIRDRHMAEYLAQADWSISPQSASAYELPREVGNFLGQSLVVEMRDILATVREINDQLTGMRRSQAEVVLSGDDRVETVWERLREWSTRYVRSRLARQNGRDGGEPLLQFQRIYGELLPHLEAIAFREGTAHKCLMAEFTDYLPWVLFRGTCAAWLDVRYDRAKLSMRFRTLASNPIARHYVNEMVQLYGWAHSGDLEVVLDRVAEEAGSGPESGNEAWVRSRLSMLGEDIQEMRPFLIRNFRPENAICQIAPDVVVSWFWAVGHGIAQIPVAASIEQMREQTHLRRAGISMWLGHGGLLACSAMPWITAERTTLSRARALSANLSIVEALHAKLWSFFEKVDVEAVMSRLRARKAESPETPPTEEDVAASCQLLAEPLSDEEALPGQTPEPKRRLQAVRMQRLLNLLADRLRCEVRQGKGSEVVIFRDGGHHFSLGHHTRNRYVPAFVIQNLLSHVGIGFDEWLAAIG